MRRQAALAFGAPMVLRLHLGGQPMRASTLILCAPFSVVLACGGTTEPQPPPQPIDSGAPEPDDAGTAPAYDAAPTAPGFPAFAIDPPQVANQGGPVLK